MRIPRRIPLRHLIIIIFIITAMILALDQWWLWGSLFQFEYLHHETYIVALLFGAVVLYVVKK
jgi:hypothetical protein